MNTIPVVDIFAGPGGLSHGFSAYSSKDIRFSIGLSVEKDVIAHRTLLLRAFLRQFEIVPDDYYHYISGKKITLDCLKTKYAAEWAKAENEAKQWKLGEKPFGQVHEAIRLAVIGGSTVRDLPYWILLGGPPCQAYSLAGRSRMKEEKGFAQDHRHTLYREYLKIVATQQPALFIMENVKGILSAVHGSRDMGGSIFSQILSDLRSPGNAVQDEQDVKEYLPKDGRHYKIYSFVTKSTTPESLKPREFVIRSEHWGIPQQRHRVILLGVRDDIAIQPCTLDALFSKETCTVEDMLKGLPKIRSRISRGGDSPKKWATAIKRITRKNIMNAIPDEGLRRLIKASASKLNHEIDSGSDFKSGSFSSVKLADWICDQRLKGVIQHEARSHMRSDLLRYFYAACAAKHGKVSPKLRNYPKVLLPKHKNAKNRKNKKLDFEDRFRVQVPHKFATTITSHISKDGHYYIHYDPLQCRSLTVREAARLQTFPDSYFFEGGRTDQYHQVGNAVPSLLSVKLAAVVADLTRRWKNQATTDALMFRKAKAVRAGV